MQMMTIDDDKFVQLIVQLIIESLKQMVTIDDDQFVQRSRAVVEGSA